MKDVTLYAINTYEEIVDACIVSGITRGKLRYNKDGTVRVIDYPGSKKKNHRNEAGYVFIGWLTEIEASTRLIEILEEKEKTKELDEKIYKLKRRITLLKRYDEVPANPKYWARIKL